MDDKIKGAIVGFNLGFGGYMLVRSVPTLWNGRIIDGNWMVTQVLIALGIGIVLAGIAYVAMMQMQK